MSKFTMIIKTQTQPGKRDAVRRLYEEHLMPRARQNADQELVVFVNDMQNENLFYIFEVYSSAEASQANAQAPWFWEYMKAVGPLLDGQPEVMTGAPALAKGITL
jgi:quinol monooxygenase YgiN